jgi:hypothetical protein
MLVVYFHFIFLKFLHLYFFLLKIMSISIDFSLLKKINNIGQNLLILLFNQFIIKSTMKFSKHFFFVVFVLKYLLSLFLRYYEIFKIGHTINQ